MPARTPAEVDFLVIEALNAGDLGAALALYGRYATFVPEPGKPVSGHTAIREALGGFLAIKPRLTVEVPQVPESGDLALLSPRWTLKRTAPDGSPIELAGQGAEVVRRRGDGTRRFVIDDLFPGAGG